MLRLASVLVLSLAALQTVEEATPEAPIERFDDPYAAYEAGAFDQALQGFMDQQVEHPEDPAVALNVGNSHYQMRNFAEADRLFGKASLSTEPDLQAEALYNLGNSAYRQGRLQEAVELYKAALEMNSDDEDAKFNLEFVRDEIRRRHEEAQKRQQEQQENQPQDQNQEPEQSQQESEGQPDEQPQGSDQDSDQDGLPDRIEEQGENPTDPNNPDSDGDGLPDGAEDLNRDGGVDPEETDPNIPDTDGDGVPDGQETMSSEQQGEAQAQEADGTLTPEEAERYLQAVEEGQPDRGRRRSGNRRRNEKDW